MSKLTLRPVRWPWIDVAKGIGILLVVAGHEIRGLADAQILPFTPKWHFLDDWIYAFHMPLFLFISGLFIAHSLKKPFGVFVLEKIRTIAYPYFLWSTITIIVKSVVEGGVNHHFVISDLPEILYDPIDQFWFLYALFVLFLIVGALMKVGVNRWIILVLAIVFNPKLSPIPIPPWPGLIVAALVGMYFVLGVVAWSERMIEAVSAVKTPLLAVACPAGLSLAALAAWIGGPDRPYLAVTCAIGGVVGALALARLIDQTRLAELFRLLGRRSLEIYLAHTLAAAGLRIALVKIAHVTAAAPHFLLGGIAGVCVPIAMAWAFERVGFEWAYRVPSAVWARPLLRSSPQASNI